MPTRVLLISGSLRQGSLNGAALRAIQGLAGTSAVAEFGVGAEALPHFSPDLESAADLPAQVAALRQEVRDADALLICTPEYAGALPGSFKNLLDWLIGDGHPRSICEKPVAWINISAAPTGATDAHESLERVLRYASARIVTSACVHLPISRSIVSADGLIEDPALLASLAEALRELVAVATDPGPELTTGALRPGSGVA